MRLSDGLCDVLQAQLVAWGQSGQDSVLEQPIWLHASRAHLAADKHMLSTAMAVLQPAADVIVCRLQAILVFSRVRA